MPTKAAKKSPAVQGTKGSLFLLLWMVSLAWLLECVDIFWPGGTWDRQLAILPRTWPALLNIFTSPFAHGNFAHLISNTVPWLILGVLTYFGEKRKFLATTIWLIVISGVGTWAIGRGALHLGASGLVYGYFGYVIGRAWFARKVAWILLALVAVVLFGSMIGGVIPTRGAISWEGHLAGLVGGFYLASRRRKEAS